jgi:hypothetical protein
MLEAHLLMSDNSPDIAPTKPDLPVRRVVRRESRRCLS